MDDSNIVDIYDSSESELLGTVNWEGDITTPITSVGGPDTLSAAGPLQYLVAEDLVAGECAATPVYVTFDETTQSYS